MIEPKSAVASGVSVAAYLGVNLAEADLFIRCVVGILTAISIVVLILVNLKKLREKR